MTDEGWEMTNEEIWWQIIRDYDRSHITRDDDIWLKNYEFIIDGTWLIIDSRWQEITKCN